MNQDTDHLKATNGDGEPIEESPTEPERNGDGQPDAPQLDSAARSATGSNGEGEGSPGTAKREPLS